jgi:hypothetical protein
MTSDGGNRCRVASPVPPPPYIRPGWFPTAHRRRLSASSDSAPMRRDLMFFPTSVEY